MKEDERRRLQAQLAVAFRPSAPIERKSLFSGRSHQVDMVINAVLQPGQHVVLYGERGVGKTSLARVLAEIFSAADIKTVDSYTINCDTTDSFSSLWHKAFKDLTWQICMASGHFDTTESIREVTLDRLIPEKVTPDDVRRALSTVKESVIIVFDEFDQIRDPEAKALMAHTIKTLSDHSVDTTILVVGVAQAVVELIAEHQSIERALVEVPMPRMSAEELGQIITKGLSQAEVKMNEAVHDKIVRLSHGLPHFTHLLSLESGRCAVDRGSTCIEDCDFALALDQIVKSKHTIANAYYSAVSSSYKASRHRISLLACALSPMDEQGYFQASDVAATLSKLEQGKHKKYTVSDVQKHLTEFVSGTRGGIIQRTGSIRRYKYRFTNPLVQPYTIIHSLSDKLISESALWVMSQPFFG